MPTAYCYIRFSKSEQSIDDSIRRQLEQFVRFAELNNLTLDTTLQLYDFGISASQSDKVVTGKLGQFISAIETGAVKPGSYLLINTLDQLSKIPVLSAFELFSQLLKKDITIVTLADNRIYTRDNYSEMGNMLYCLSIMSFAHQQSLIKSKRAKATWEFKRQQARDGKHKLTKVCPAWMKLKNEKFILIPERVTVVKRIYKMALNGLGYASIANQLNNEKVPPFNSDFLQSNGWHKSHIARILKNPAVYGQFTPHITIEGKKVPQDPIVSYYPAVISKEEFEAVQSVIASKKTAKGIKR